VAGVIGRSKFSYDLWATPATPPAASRLTVPGCIQVTDRTYRRPPGRYRLQPGPLGRVVALMGDADQVAAGPEGADDLGGRRQRRHHPQAPPPDHASTAASVARAWLATPRRQG
jgi:hypothetical protein